MEPATDTGKTVAGFLTDTGNPGDHGKFRLNLVEKSRTTKKQVAVKIVLAATYMLPIYDSEFF